MTELPHFTRFARALALGAAVTTTAVAACNNSTTSDPNASATTTTAGSSGSETPVNPATDSDAGAATQPTDTTTAVALSGNACTTVGEERANPHERGSLCTCTAAAPGSATWQCSLPQMPIAGPLAPPELAA